MWSTRTSHIRIPAAGRGVKPGEQRWWLNLTWPHSWRYAEPAKHLARVKYGFSKVTIRALELITITPTQTQQAKSLHLIPCRYGMSRMGREIKP